MPAFMTVISEASIQKSILFLKVFCFINEVMITRGLVPSPSGYWSADGPALQILYFEASQARPAPRLLLNFNELWSVSAYLLSETKHFIFVFWFSVFQNSMALVFTIFEVKSESEGNRHKIVFRSVLLWMMSLKSQYVVTCIVSNFLYPNVTSSIKIPEVLFQMILDYVLLIYFTRSVMSIHYLRGMCLFVFISISRISSSCWHPVCWLECFKVCFVSFLLFLYQYLGIPCFV